MIGRIVWFAVLLAAAIVTAALQLDKQAESHPALATLVPAPLRNYAQTHIAAAAVEGDDTALALAETRKLVGRRPIPAEYLTLLAVAQASTGQAEQSGLTIQIAGQRGWREPVAQETVLRLALVAGDKGEAARRYTALLLRAETPDVLLIELGPQILGEPADAGREAMVDVVVGGKRWHEVFLRRGSQVMPPAAFSAIAASSLLEGAAFDCEALRQSIATLEQRDTDAANQLSVAAGAGRCPQLAPPALRRL